MDTPLKYIPAHELLKARYSPQKALEVFQKMTREDYQKVSEIFENIRDLKFEFERIYDADMLIQLSTTIVRENFPVSENVIKYFQYLGYRVQYLNYHASYSQGIPILIIGI